jgi:DNA polymerase alpha subunit A
VKDDEQAKRDANDRNITEFFTKGAIKKQLKAKARLTHSPGKTAS